MLLACSLLLGLFSQAALAEKDAKARFTDVSEDDWSWPYVLELHLKGLMNGTGDGRFEPQAPLTRAQAVTVAVRLVGLEQQALALQHPETSLEFTDRDTIPDWARPYVAMAAVRDILPVAEDGLFRPNEKATRLWVSVLLVRALGYDAEAQAKMSATLPFRDARVIPSSLVGYVAAAVDHRLVQGFPDGTFQPNQPITRAQAAALLSRTDDQLAEQGRTRPDILVGELVRAASNGRSLTLRVQGRERVVSVHQDAAIFLEGAKASLNKLPVGARLSVILDQNGTAMLVVARKPEVATPQQEVRGVITEVLRPEEMAGGVGLVVIKPDREPERSYTLAPAVTIRYEGRTLALKDLRVGDEVVVRVAAGVAVSIEVKERAPAPPREEVIRGTLTAVQPGSGSSQGTLSIRSGNQTRTLRVAANAVIAHGRERLSLADLRVGDEVTVRVLGGVVNQITVERMVPRGETVTGTIRAIYEVSISFEPSIEVQTASGVRTLTLAPEATIRHGGSRLELGDLRIGDQVTVQVMGGVAVSIEVVARGAAEQAEEVKGVIEEVYLYSTSFQPSIKVKTSAGSRTIPVSADAEVTRDGRRIELGDLQKGQSVTMRVESGIVTAIAVTDPQQAYPLKGKIIGIFERKITIQTDDGKFLDLTLTTDAQLTYRNKPITVDRLYTGDRVSLKMRGDLILALEVIERDDD
jgi:hypothetical protein